MGALRPVVFPVPPTRRVLPAVCGTGVFVPGVSTTVVLRGLLVVALLSALPGGLMPTLALAEADADEPWKRVQSSDGSAAVARHEASAVTVGGKLYLIGGRGMRPVQVYDPATKRWRTTTP